jgi:flagellar motor switch protein FliN/FliY
MPDEKPNEKPEEKPEERAGEKPEEKAGEKPGEESGDGRTGQPAKFAALEEEGKPAAARENLELILDIDVDVTVELGRTSMMIKDVLELSPGSVIELDKLAGESVEIYVNQSLVAKGEVVVINENFGVRITEIIGAAARIQHLGSPKKESDKE